MPTVSTLRVAPVKGLSTVTRDRIHVDAAGVAEDRRVFLLNDRGTVITLRSHPEFVRIAPDLDLESGILRITLPTGAVAASALGDAAEPVSAELYGKQRRGRVLPGEVAEALSSVAGERVRVVLADTTGVGWDEGPVSILGRASAEYVGGADHDRRRYRMLVEVDGTEPFEEDTWVGRDLELGNAVVRVSHPLVRCAIITQSPATGDKDWDGLHVLAEKRGPELCLGVIAEVVAPGDVEVGAPVRVLAAR